MSQVFGLSNSANGGGDLGRSEFGGRKSLGFHILSLKCLDSQVRRLNSHTDVTVLSSDNKNNNKEKLINLATCH